MSGKGAPDRNEWLEWLEGEHVARYLSRADDYPHRAEADAALLEQVPVGAERVLDLGTGDGRVLAMLRERSPRMEGVGVDNSAPMLGAARERFAGAQGIEILEHDLSEPLPELGAFDAVVSSFAIHHLPHERKRALYGEALERLEGGGAFVNLEHVASPTPRLHREFFEAIGEPPEHEDPSDRLLDVETQLGWLRELGFADVDCFWKWREMAVLAGRAAG